MSNQKIIDPNMVAQKNHGDNIRWVSVPSDEVALYGADGALSRRISDNEIACCSSGIQTLRCYPAGVRVRFGTDSRQIFVRATYGIRQEPTCLSVCAIYGFDLYRCEADGHEVFRHTYRPPVNFDRQLFDNDPYNAKDPGFSNYTLNLPIFSEITSLEIGIEEDSALTRGAAYFNEDPVIFYGSSITHGAAASRPGTTYESFISQKYNLNYRNLGFAGNAKGEPELARYFTRQKMSAFVCDYDYNAPTPEHLKQTHEPFYRIIREAFPDLPYIMVSRPNFFANPEAAKRNRDIILETFRHAQEDGDRNVWFVDGELLLQGEFMESCTVEGCHPTDIGFLRMANHIGSCLMKAMGK